MVGWGTLFVKDDSIFIQDIVLQVCVQLPREVCTLSTKQECTTTQERKCEPVERKVFTLNCLKFVCNGL